MLSFFFFVCDVGVVVDADVAVMVVDVPVQVVVGVGMVAKIQLYCPSEAIQRPNFENH